jgi:microcystin degradation protein MlrC
MRVGILALLQESNTFISATTGMDEFVADVLARGDEVRERFQFAPHEIGGFFAGLAEEQVQAVPLFAARALPYGVIRAGVIEDLLASMFDELQKAQPLDGLLVAPHGATVAENHLDADGYWLSRIRSAVGPHVPIVGTMDPHANLSKRMVAACSALVAYRTNPHVDQRERGVEAARLLVKALRNGVRPVMAAAFPPLALGIERQATDEMPCHRLCQYADAMREIPGVLSVSIVFGFPYADVPEMGASAVVVTDGDESQAAELAQRVAARIWEARHEFGGNLLRVEPALDNAVNAEPPVCLLDMGDNVGGGAPADGTWLAHALLERRIADSLIVICDPQAVRAAAMAQIGERVRAAVGGYCGPLSGTPVNREFVVVSLSEGRSIESRPTHGGFTAFDHGRTVVMRTAEGLTIVATERRMAPFSLSQLRACGIEPAHYRVLVAKGVHAPIAAYREVCRSFIRVDTPGVTAADMTRLQFRRRRRPMFPFEADCEWPARDRVARS